MSVEFMYWIFSMIQVASTIVLIWATVQHIRSTRENTREYLSLIELEMQLGMKGIIGNDDENGSGHN